MNRVQKTLTIWFLGVVALLAVIIATTQNTISIGKSYRHSLQISHFAKIDIHSSNVDILSSMVEINNLQGLKGKLAVIMEENERNSLFVVNFDQDVVLNVSTLYEPNDLDWCTEHMIAVSSREGSIYIVDLMNATSLLVYGANRWEVSARNVSCSPNGTQIAFTSERNGQPNIYIVNIDSQKIIQYTNAPIAAYSPMWSPDGTRLIYSTIVDDNNASTRYHLVELTQGDLASTERNVLYKGVSVSSAVWSQDNKIAFSAYIDPYFPSFTYVLNLDSKKVEKVAGDLFDSYFTSEVFFTWSKNPRYAMFVADDGNGYSLYLLDFDTKILSEILNEDGDFRDIDWN